MCVWSTNHLVDKPQQKEMAAMNQMGNPAPVGSASVNVPSATPPGAPVDAIRQFMALRQVKRGENKDKGPDVTAAQLKAARQSIIAYMESANLPFITVNGEYLYVKTNEKLCPWKDDLVLEAFVAFHRMKQGQNNGNESLSDLAVQFMDFCKELRRRQGSTDKDLVCNKKRPLSATISALVNMGRM
jgi:hypothetical protein